MIYTFLVLGMLFVAGTVFTIKKMPLAATIVWVVLGICSAYVLIYGGLPR